MAGGLIALLLSAAFVCVQGPKVKPSPNPNPNLSPSTSPKTNPKPVNPRLGADRDLDISKMWLKKVNENPAAARKWKLSSVDLFLHQVNSHFAIVLSSLDSTEPDDILYDFDVGEAMTSVRTDRYPYHLAQVEKIRELLPDGTFSQESMTLGRLTDCVSAAGLDTMRGRCFLFAMRVLRFAAGDCVCGACNDDGNDINQMIKLKAATVKNVRLAVTAKSNVAALFADKKKKEHLEYWGQFMSPQEKEGTPAILDKIQQQMDSIFTMQPRTLDKVKHAIGCMSLGCLPFAEKKYESKYEELLHPAGVPRDVKAPDTSS